MFNGLVQKTGTLVRKLRVGKTCRLRFRVTDIQRGMKRGESLAVNGVCLTVVQFGKTFVEVDVVPATLRVTNLKLLAPGDPVNVERSLKVSDRLSGHWVQGHVDGVGTVAGLKRQGGDDLLTIRVPAKIRKWIADKASVAVNGVSLTVQRLSPAGFTVALIPETLRVTNLGSVRSQDRVNIEVDMLAKHVYRAVQALR